MATDSNSKVETRFDSDQILPIGLLVGLIGVLSYGYLNTLQQTAASWQNPRYSLGVLDSVLRTIPAVVEARALWRRDGG